MARRWGLAQAMALIPGVSRSGGTITVGLLLGLDARCCGAVFFFAGQIPAAPLTGFYMLLVQARAHELASNGP